MKRSVANVLVFIGYELFDIGIRLFASIVLAFVTAYPLMLLLNYVLIPFAFESYRLVTFWETVKLATFLYFIFSILWRIFHVSN